MRLFICSVFLLWLFGSPLQAEVVIFPIVFEKEKSFPDVHMGEIVDIEFKGKNKSKDKVQIEQVLSSCGCTVMDFPKDPILAGDDVVIKVSINTAQKTGEIHKFLKVYLKGFDAPLDLKFKGKILPQSNPHMKKGQAIFSQKCSACHANAGMHKTGYQLYLADCASCHGVMKEGLSAPPLPLEKFKHDSTKMYLKQMIANGSANKLMPAFAEKHKGPLKEYQINSLVTYLQMPHPIRNLHQQKGLPVREIYQHLCSTCHGSLRKGRIGPDITQEKLKHYSHQDLVKLLSYGRKGGLMPAYLKEKGGMLSDNQIASLARFLKEDSKVSSSR